MYRDSQRLFNFKRPETTTSLSKNMRIENADRPPPFFEVQKNREVRHVHERWLQLHVLVLLHKAQDFRVRRERNHLNGCYRNISIVHYGAVFVVIVIIVFIILRLLMREIISAPRCRGWLQVEGKRAIQLACDKAFEQWR